MIVFFQAEDGIRDLVRSRGLGDVYKRQLSKYGSTSILSLKVFAQAPDSFNQSDQTPNEVTTCLLYTSDAADERSSVDLGGRRIIKKKNTITLIRSCLNYKQ